MTPGRERIVRFGPEDGLFGILSTPRTPLPDMPHIVMINAGVVHRVGPNRLYVDMARALTAQGFCVLRFDLAGLGDSEATGSGLSIAESAVTDVRMAMDFLERSRKAKTFVVCGLCSGANYAALTTDVDERIVGAVLIDPAVSRTLRSTLIHYVRRMKHLETWSLVVGFKHPIWERASKKLGLRPDGPSELIDNEELERAATPDYGPETRKRLRRTLDRGTEMLIVFTGGLNGQYNYRNQLYDLLPGFDFAGRLQLEFLPETDHAVSDQKSRTTLIQTMEGWLRRCFGRRALGTEVAS